MKAQCLLVILSSTTPTLQDIPPSCTEPLCVHVQALFPPTHFEGIEAWQDNWAKLTVPFHDLRMTVRCQGEKCIATVFPLIEDAPCMEQITNLQRKRKPP